MSQLNPEIWAIVSEQFHALVDLSLLEQRAAIQELQKKHPKAVAPLLKLLQAESDPHPVLQTNPTHPWQISDDQSLVGSEIGVYRLIEHVGSGGMGSVFLAERNTADFERKEALKLIRPGGLGKEAERRFKQERQILANLTHPNIARLYDGGTTSEGRLYFTMEHVEGQDIISHLKAKEAGLAERLALFLQVAKAISYAHSRLVLHLDLKPSNIMVTAAGEAKILDFGVAERLNETDVSFSTELNEASHRYTLAYGSPEQLRGESLSTQSDIYTLGVLLYEILVGQLPFPYENDSLTNYKQKILSTRIKRPSDHNAFAQAEINTSKLKGDLDAIVLACLSRDAKQRYASVDVLINDIEAYQENRPISLRERDSWYALGKFARRNRAWLSAVAVGVLGLLALGTYYTAELRVERNEARSEAEKNKQLLELVQGIFVEADPLYAQGDTLTVYDLVEQTNQRLDTSLLAQPELRMELLLTIGKIALGINDYGRGDSILQKSQAILAQNPPIKNTPLHARLLSFQGDLEYGLGKYAEATASTTSSLEIMQGLGTRVADLYDHYHRLGNLAIEQSLSVEADSFYQLGLSALLIAENPRKKEIAYLTHALGALNRDLGNLDLAETYLKRSLKVKMEVFEEPHSEIGYTLNNLASLFHAQGMYDTALVYARDGLNQRLATLGDAHLETAASYGNMHRVYAELGFPDSALMMINAAATVVKKLFPEAHPYHIGSYSQIGSHHNSQGDFVKGEAAYRSGIDVLNELIQVNPQNPYNFHRSLMYHGLALSLSKQERHEEALPFAQKAVAFEAKLNRSETYLATKEATLANILVSLGRFAEAQPLLLAAQSVLESLPERYGSYLAMIKQDLETVRNEE